MSIIQQQALRERTKSLAHSGSVWSDKVTETQKELVRQLSLHAVGVDQATDLLGIGLHLADGTPQIRGSYSWAFVEQDIKYASPGRWGYVSSGGDYSFRLQVTTIDEAETVNNPTGELLPFLQEDGMVIILPPGERSDARTEAGYLELVDKAHYSGTSGIGGVYNGEALLTISAEDSEPFVLLDSGAYLGVLSSSIPVTRSPTAAWFLKLPVGTLPLSLETAQGELVEGSAFHTVDGWLILRQDPYLLWPDGIVHLSAVIRAPDGPKHFALKTDRSQAAGKWVANYKRQSQSPGSFIKALAEVAGLPIYTEDDQVIAIESCASGFRYHTLNGEAFLLPGPAAYKVGDYLLQGEFPRALMDIRCQPLQGDQWWEGRSWFFEGIDISAIRPGFSGFSINTSLTLAESYEDPTDGSLRARLMFGSGLEEEEARFWSLQAAMERRAGVETFAKDILGFTHPGDSKWVNPLQIYAGVFGPWLWVIESPLPRYSAGIWREVEDFIAREKPAGVIVAGVAV